MFWFVVEATMIEIICSAVVLISLANLCG